MDGVFSVVLFHSEKFEAAWKFEIWTEWGIIVPLGHNSKQRWQCLYSFYQMYTNSNANHILLSFCWRKYNCKLNVSVSVWIYFYVESRFKIDGVSTSAKASYLKAFRLLVIYQLHLRPVHQGTILMTQQHFLAFFSLSRNPSPTCPPDRQPMSREKVNQRVKLYILNKEMIIKSLLGGDLVRILLKLSEPWSTQDHDTTVE